MCQIVKRLSLWLLLWLLPCQIAVAAMTLNCSGTNNQTPMRLHGSYAFSGPLHQSNLRPNLPQNQLLACANKLSLPSTMEAYVQINPALQWQMVGGRDYIDLGNGLGLLVEVANSIMPVYRPLVRHTDQVQIFTGFVRVPMGINYRLTLQQIGPLRAGFVRLDIGSFTIDSRNGRQQSAGILVSFNLTQGPVLSCSMPTRNFVVTLAPVPRRLLLANQGAEVFGGTLMIDGLRCPQAGVRVRAVLSDNHDPSIKNWLTAFNANGSESGVGFRFKDQQTGQVFLFGPETTQPNVGHQFDFKPGLTVNNDVLSKLFEVYYVNAPNGRPIEAGPLKGHGLVTFSYQ